MKNPPRIEAGFAERLGLADQAQRGRRSLFGEVLDWMLAPLLILWPLSMALEFVAATSIADAAYDRELRTRVEVLAGQLRFREGRLQAELTEAAVALLRADPTPASPGINRLFELEDAIGEYRSFFQVRGLSDEIIAGDQVLPTIDFTPELQPGRIYLTNHEIRGVSLRAAYSFAQVPGMVGAALVQVAETEDKRIKLAGEISSKILAVQFILVPVALVLVWLGLTRGIAPINRLVDRIRRRRPADLSPIDLADVPEEVTPLLTSINDLMSRLATATQAQRRFVADAAHQLRTPLAGLRTQAELALRQHDRANIEDSLRQMAISVDRASRLVNQLLALARAEGSGIVRTQLIDLNELARSVMHEWVPPALAKSIDLGFEPARAPVNVEGSEPLLRELLNNLIDNALRYTPSGGRVTCRVLDGERRGVEIEDTGIGIEAADMPLVFERFYRVLGTNASGSGLGLAIVKEIGEAHGGSVSARSAGRDQGSVFYVHLPAVVERRGR